MGAGIKQCGLCFKEIDGDRAKSSATKYHEDCAYLVRLKSNRDNNKNKFLLEHDAEWAEKWRAMKRQTDEAYRRQHRGLSTKHVRAFRAREKARRDAKSGI